MPTTLRGSYRTPDLTGTVVGRLLILERVGGPHVLWKCRCRCGTVRLVRQEHLIGKRLTHSCGCLRDEALLASARKHGGYRAVEYRIWRAMIARCEDMSNHAHARYGGRGIRVCKRWRENFAAFLTDMGQRPTPHHTLERVDNDGPYAPDNCCWATMKEQALNTRKSIVVDYAGERMSLLEFSRRMDVAWSSLYRRVKIHGQHPLYAARELQRHD